MVFYMKSANSRPINKDQFYYYRYCPNSEVDTDEKWLYREIAKTLKFKIHNDFNYILDKYERLVNLDSSEYKNLSGYHLQYSFSEMKQLFNL